MTVPAWCRRRVAVGRQRRGQLGRTPISGHLLRSCGRVAALRDRGAAGRTRSPRRRPRSRAGSAARRPPGRRRRAETRRPASVSANSLAGRPRPRSLPRTLRSGTSDDPAGSDQGIKVAAHGGGVRPNRSLRQPALCGPCSCSARTTRSRVRASSVAAAGATRTASAVRHRRLRAPSRISQHQCYLFTPAARTRRPPRGSAGLGPGCPSARARRRPYDRSRWLPPGPPTAASEPPAGARGRPRAGGRRRRP